MFRSVGGSIGGIRREGTGAESENTRTRAKGGLGGEGKDEPRTVARGGVWWRATRVAEERGEKEM